MSEIVNLELRVMKRNGNEAATYYKQIEMTSAPTIDIKISEEDVVLEPHSIVYDIPSGHYYVSFWEYLTDSPVDAWDFMCDHDWSKKGES